MQMTKHLHPADSELGMINNIARMEGNLNNYLQWNLSVFPIEKHKNILDIGCGPGTYFHEIMRYGPSSYYGIDYSDLFMERLKILFGNHPNCKASKVNILDFYFPNYFNGTHFDYVLCFDVLEHIENDRQALVNIYRTIRITGFGKLFLRVPAIQFIYGENDRAIGHYRRYSIKSLKKLLSECNFNIEAIRYQNLVGIIPWWIIGKLSKRSLAISATEGRFFNGLVPTIKLIENLVPIPLGLSIYCICNICH